VFVHIQKLQKKTEKKVEKWY